MVNSKSPRVGLVVDHPLRDLPGMVLLALELAQRGIETALIPLYEQGVDVPLMALDSVVLNFARQVNEPLAQKYALLGIPVFVMDTEGGILSDKGRVAPRSIAAFVRDSAFAKVLSGYFFWGEAMHEAFLAEAALPEDRLFLTGCPRFDYYAPALAGLEPPKRTGHVLVNTNFPVVNPRFALNKTGDAEALRSVGMADEYIAMLQSENRRVMLEMIDLVARLAADLPNQQFVLRPHPFERWEAYSEALGYLPNVVIDGNGPVLDALRGAYALLHLNCGTAIEALMLELPPLAPEWINSEFMLTHASLPSRASRAVHSYDEMRNLLASGNPAAGFDMAASYRATAWRYFHHADGQARTRVADVLEAAVRQRSAPSKPFYAASIVGSHPHARLAQRAQGLLANLLGSALTRDLRIRHRPARAAKRILPQDVDRQMTLLARFLDLPQPSVAKARHPLSGLPLSSVLITPPAQQPLDTRQ
jgi:surface carbohydrate biosynthesis protein